MASGNAEKFDYHLAEMVKLISEGVAVKGTESRILEVKVSYSAKRKAAGISTESIRSVVFDVSEFDQKETSAHDWVKAYGRTL